MTKVIKIIVIQTLFLCYPFAQESSKFIDEILKKVNIDSLVQYVSYLTGAEPVFFDNERYTILSRHKEFPGNELAAIYIENTLIDFGLDTKTQKYSSTGKNIIASQLGQTFPNKRYILCAHYDSMPGGVISPGADDNASGVAVVLEAARVLSEYFFDYSIEYIFWDEEEQWLIGSYNYLENEMNNNSSEILGVINIDMIGWDGNDDGVMLVNTREIGNSVELANRVIDVNLKYSINLNPQIVMPGYGSDNMAFWAYGISSIGIEEHYGVDWNPFYHTTYDDISHFNMSYFHRNTKLSIGVLATSAQIIQQSLTTEGITTLREYNLLKNYPNPFNSGTTINYYLPNEDNVSLKIYDLKGNQVRYLDEGIQSAGNHSIYWDSIDDNGNIVSSGVYFYILKTNQFIIRQKMLMIK